MINNVYQFMPYLSPLACETACFALVCTLYIIIKQGQNIQRWKKKILYNYKPIQEKDESLNHSVTIFC